jgi:RNA polymerase sigma-70 factor (ECF subfamily)
VALSGVLPRPHEPAAATEERRAELDAFWRGDRTALDRCYRQNFRAVERAIGGVLSGADRETIIHEVFARLIASEDLRRAYSGGSMGAWLGTVARNQAIDYQRRLGREITFNGDVGASDNGGTPWRDAAEARVLIEQFRRERLRPEWAEVFELRFLGQLTQQEASRALGLRRTTLAYRELRIRHALKMFLREEDSNP